MKNFCNAKEAMKKRKRAFTLVEVLIVVVIIGILFVTLMVNLGFSTDKANMAGVQNDFHAFQTAIKLVAMEEQGLNVPIESLKLSINKKLDTGLKLSVIEGGSMYSSGVDPWGTEYRLDYSQPANTNGQIILVSAGPDNKYDTADDIKSTIRYDTGDGNKVVVDGEILEQDTSIFNTQLTFKPEINNTEFDNAFNTCTNSSTSSMLAVSPTSFTTYTIVEGTNYSIKGSKDAITGIRVVKYVANGVSYWHLNQEAAAYVGQQEPGWYTVNGATYTKCNTQLSVTISNVDTINALNHEGLKYLFNGVHEHDYSSKVLTADYIKTPGTCIDKAIYYFACTCGRMSTTTFEGDKDTGNHPAGDENYHHEYIQKTAEEHIHKSTCLQCHEVVIEEDQVHDFGGTLLCKQCSAIKHTHNYSRQLTDSKYLKSVATCTSPALYYYVCETCEAYDDAKTWASGSALGHEGAAATCTTAAVCTRCNNTYQAALGHDFTRQDARTDLQVSEATCTKPAIYYYLCARCDEVSTLTWNDLGSVLGHAFNKQITDDKYLAVAATCVTPAKYYFSCRCGEFDAHGAMFESGTANGSHIGGTRIEYEQIADDYSYHTKETVCETCSMVLDAEPEAHRTQDNLFCYLCDFEIHVCDYSEKKEEDAYLSFPATCTTTAVYYFACTEPNCTKHGVSTYPSGAALEHTYTSAITTNPTCTADGVRTYTCTRYWINPVNGNRINCNHEYTDSVPALGHEFTGEFTTQQYLARPATCVDPAAYYFCCEREGCGAASGSTFLAGAVNPNAHFGELIAVGTADVCSRYSCCNGGVVREHTYLLDASKYYWGGYGSDVKAATAANCSAFTMEAVCGCGYVTVIQKTPTLVNQTAANCTSDGSAKYHKVTFTINGQSTTFYCDEHNTPLTEAGSDYTAYQNAYLNTYHKIPTALGHSFSTNPTHSSVSYTFNSTCSQATLTRTCMRSGCDEIDTTTVNTEKIVLVARACGVAEQYVMQATFGVLQSNSQKIRCTAGECPGHTGTKSTHIGNTVYGAYTNGVLGDGTAFIHSSCDACKTSKSSGNAHTFTATATLSSNHPKSMSYEDAIEITGSTITLTYVATCSGCGYSYSNTVSPEKGNVYQSQTNCDTVELSYYSFTDASLKIATGDTNCNSNVLAVVKPAIKKATGRSGDYKCCAYYHISKETKTHTFGSATTYAACSSSRGGSYYRWYCTRSSCSYYKEAKYENTTPDWWGGDCKTLKQKSYIHTFTYNGTTYTIDCYNNSGHTNHNTSTYGSHSLGTTKYNYGCPQNSSYFYSYATCSICKNDYRISTLTYNNVFVGVNLSTGYDSYGENYFYLPYTSSPSEVYWCDSGYSSYTLSYYSAGSKMIFGTVANTDSNRGSTQVRYYTSWTDFKNESNYTVKATGSAACGAEWTLTFENGQSYCVKWTKVLTKDAILNKNDQWYYICHVSSNAVYDFAKEWAHGTDTYTGCGCDDGTKVTLPPWP